MCTERDESQAQESEEAEQQEPQLTTEEIHETLKDFFGF